MTPAIAQIIWWVGAIAWFGIMYPHIRRSRKMRTTQRPGATRERVLMLISLTGLFLIPAFYTITGIPQFANYAFRPVQAWLGVVVLVCAVVLFFHSHGRLGPAWSGKLALRDNRGLAHAG